MSAPCCVCTTGLISFIVLYNVWSFSGKGVHVKAHVRDTHLSIYK